MSWKSKVRCGWVIPVIVVLDIVCVSLFQRSHGNRAPGIASGLWTCFGTLSGTRNQGICVALVQSSPLDGRHTNGRRRELCFLIGLVVSSQEQSGQIVTLSLAFVKESDAHTRNRFLELELLSMVTPSAPLTLRQRTSNWFVVGSCSFACSCIHRFMCL